MVRLPLLTGGAICNSRRNPRGAARPRRQVSVFNQDCSFAVPGCSGSVNYNGDILISPTAGGFVHAERKFLVAHELGHWIEKGWRAGKTGGGGNYFYNDPVPLCGFVGLGDHAMFSREADFLSYQEGIAHFISATAWNNPAPLSGAFKFYKNDPPYNFDLYNLDSSTVAVPFNWENINCSPKLVGLSTEGDWLRQIWNYGNDTGWGVPIPSTFDISEHVRSMFLAGGINASNAYARFKASVANNYPIFSPKWDGLATFHGPVDP